jgi:hypothetical protein
LAPRCAEIEDFVNLVMASWRADGGEPDIGLSLPLWLNELGFEIRSLLPMIDVVTASHFVWQWPRSFIEVGLRRLVELGRLTADAAGTTWRAFLAMEATPHALMITPAVLEIIAVRH